MYWIKNLFKEKQSRKQKFNDNPYIIENHNIKAITTSLFIPKHYSMDAQYIYIRHPLLKFLHCRIMSYVWSTVALYAPIRVNNEFPKDNTYMYWSYLNYFEINLFWTKVKLWLVNIQTERLLNVHYMQNVITKYQHI